MCGDPSPRIAARGWGRSCACWTHAPLVKTRGGIVAGMELGAAALAFGLVAMLILSAIRPDWLKAAGGFLILVTVIAIALQLLGLA